MTQVYCGVDVSGAALDARIGPSGPELRVARTPEGVAELAAFYRAHGATLVVMEATGGYERAPYVQLWAHGVACALANANAVRQFARAMGFLEKTDRIDAGVIAGFAAARAIGPGPAPDEDQSRLRALVTRLRQLVELKVDQANQRRLVDQPAVLDGIDELTALVRRQIRALEADIAAALDADPLWRRLDHAFRSIKGVAGRTVARLLAELPEIGALGGKAVAKLAGLAPLADDSGRRGGRRHIRGGRGHVRSILFVVAEIVRRHDPDFAAFHRKLKDAGKRPKVVRVALARKLLVRLNAKARDVRAEFAAHTLLAA